MTPEVDRNQPVQVERRTQAIEGQSLVTECRWNPAGAKECGEQMTLGVTEACSMLQDARRCASDNGNAVVNAVSHGIPNPQKAPPGDLLIIGGITGNFRSRRHNRGSGAVNDFGRLEKLVHRITVQNRLTLRARRAAASARLRMRLPDFGARPPRCLGALIRRSQFFTNCTEVTGIVIFSSRLEAPVTRTVRRSIDPDRIMTLRSPRRSDLNPHVLFADLHGLDIRSGTDGG